MWHWSRHLAEQAEAASWTAWRRTDTPPSIGDDTGRQPAADRSSAPHDPDRDDIGR
ncbi:hypothetical protein [Nocardia blacklockiae]|uniref:hypothetical protein n=1 Tax=Nocardia blacklockiae TaxID=480036 RepID=UPI00189527A9|nr:hypothetical protein [Nocardia blacklockiae]MBF6171141.1 hypothetical protein [Nocardia blacklockiae]